MDGKSVQYFLIGKWRWIIYVKEPYLFHDVYYVYVVEAFIALNWEA
jgi:hypothetical protein